ncbi:hypothetical protein [Paractinoplanes toevensis]|nr:hypothetical protein [Actinoplanes toevensis]
MMVDGSPAGRVPWLAPSAVVRRITEMRAAGGHRPAEMLLDAIGAGRTAGEVAGVVAVVDPADAGRVLAAACRRPAAEIAAILTVLADPGAPNPAAGTGDPAGTGAAPDSRASDRADRASDSQGAGAGAPVVLGRAVVAAELGAAELVSVAVLLVAVERDALLDVGVDTRLGHPGRLSALVAALSDADELGAVTDRIARGDPVRAAALATQLETIDPEAAEVLADAVLAAGAAVTGQVLARLEAEPLRRFVPRLAGLSSSAVVEVMAELVRAGRRALSRAIATAVPPVFAWPSQAGTRVLIDLVVASAVHSGRLAGLAAPGSFAAELADEPPGIVAAVLTRACAVAAIPVVDAILAELARRADTVKWVARLWHIAPEPAASGGRRPDLVDRYLDLVVQRRSPREVAGLIEELDAGDGGPMAGRVVRMLLDDPGRRWVRPYIGQLLGESPRAADLRGDWTGDRVELARAAAVEELRRVLREPGPVDRWLPVLSLRAAERPLWLVRLGDLDAGSLIGLSNRGVHCHSVPGPHAQQAPREFRIDYEQFAHLTFGFTEESHRIRIVKQQSTYFWAVGQSAVAQARGVTALLNVVATAVRAVFAVHLDEPLGPSASGWFTAERF